MLKGPCKDVNIGSIYAINGATENLKKVNVVYRELLAVLQFLDKNDKKFSKFFMAKTKMPIRVEIEKVKKVALGNLNDLYADYNVFLDNIGYYSSVERVDKLPTESADISDNPYFAMLDDIFLDEEEKYLSLSAYFHIKLDAINHQTENINTFWKDEQFDEYKERLYDSIDFSLGKYPKLFKDYGHFCAKEKGG